MRRLKDFFYNFIDLLIIVAILAACTYVVYFNLDKLMNLQSISQQMVRKESKKTVKEITITLPNGLNSKQLADILEGYKLINDKEAFINNLNETKPNAQIIAGDYKVKNNITEKELIEIVTKKGAKN